jgi:hypothetical protein
LPLWHRSTGVLRPGLRKAIKSLRLHYGHIFREVRKSRMTHRRGYPRSGMCLPCANDRLKRQADVTLPRFASDCTIPNGKRHRPEAAESE